MNGAPCWLQTDPVAPRQGNLSLSLSIFSNTRSSSKVKQRMGEDGEGAGGGAQKDSVTESDGVAVSGDGSVPPEGSSVPYSRSESEPPAFTEVCNTLGEDMLSHLHFFSTRSFPDCASPATSSSFSESSCISPADGDRLRKMEDKMRILAEKESLVASSAIDREDVPNVAIAPTRSDAKINHVHHVKLLLAHLCVISPWGSLAFHEIPSDPDFKSALDALDTTSSREVFVSPFPLSRWSRY